MMSEWQWKRLRYDDYIDLNLIITNYLEKSKIYFGNKFTSVWDPFLLRGERKFEFTKLLNNFIEIFFVSLQQRRKKNHRKITIILIWSVKLLEQIINSIICFVCLFLNSIVVFSFSYFSLRFLFEAIIKYIYYSLFQKKNENVGVCVCVLG